MDLSNLLSQVPLSNNPNEIGGHIGQVEGLLQDLKAGQTSPQEASQKLPSDNPVLGLLSQQLGNASTKEEAIQMVEQVLGHLRKHKEDIS